MNTLKLKLNPYKDINIASLDDKPLSPYSELNNYMKEPFLSWVSKLLEAAEREINDDYCLEVVSESFEALFLEGMQNDFDSCKEYRTASFQVNTSTSERFDLIRKLASKYAINYSLEAFKLPVYTDVKLSLDTTMVKSVTLEDAKLIVTKEKEIKNQLSAMLEGSIILLISDKSVVTAIGSQKYIWEICESDLDKVVNCIIDRFVKTPIIVKISELLKNVMDTMNDEDKKTLNLATEIDPFLAISELPEIEVGHSITLGVEMIPEGTELPNLRIVAQNESIISIDGLSITALMPGTTNIDIYRAEENIPFVRKCVKTYQDNFVKKIELSLSAGKMGIGRKQEVNIALIPEDAEDINSVEWSVDNADVIRVSQDGVITALKDGVATITATTTKASSSISVKVLPNISPEDKKKSVDVPSDVRALNNPENSDWTERTDDNPWPPLNIDFPDKMGLDYDKVIKPLERGEDATGLPETAYRYGGEGGYNYTCEAADGHVPSLDERALPKEYVPEKDREVHFDNDRYCNTIDAIRDYESNPAASLESLNNMIDDINAERGTNIDHLDVDELEALSDKYKQLQDTEFADVRDELGIDDKDFTAYGVHGYAKPMEDTNGDTICEGGADQFNTALPEYMLKRIGVEY